MAWLPALTTVALFLAGIVFWMWQTVYRRRFEVAEAAMIAFEKAADALNHIRNPLGFASETEDVEIPQGVNVPPEQYRRYGVVFVRVEKTNEAFVELRPTMILAEIHLGKAASNALGQLWQIRNEVVIAAGALANREQEFYDDTPEDGARKKTNDAFYAGERSKLYNLGSASKHDSLTPKIDRARKDLADACRPYLELPRLLAWFGAAKRSKS